MEDDKSEQQLTTAETGAGDTDAVPAKPAGGAAPATAPARRGATAWLALLLALAALALAGWQQYLKQQQGDVVAAQLQKVDTQSQQSATAIQQAVDASRQSVQKTAQLLEAQRQQRLQGEAGLKSRLDALQGRLLEQQNQLLALRGADRSDWALAEVEYLLRLAYQRLLMAQDSASAQALLSNADTILAELDASDLHPARAAIAADLAALRAIPALDNEGIWLRIQALASQVDALLLFELPERVVEIEELPADAGWQERLQQGFRAGMARFSSYLVIRRRDTAYQPLMDPQWERLVRQNLHMLLEQSQVALLSGNAPLYRASLENTRRWLGEFFSFNATATQALDAELEALLAIDITRDYPDIGNSLAVIQDVMAARRAAGDGS
ncbi:MAG: uroporphyrinogen-III C-methyltransferase [Halieaceae bacterium]